LWLIGRIEDELHIVRLDTFGKIIWVYRKEVEDICLLNCAIDSSSNLIVIAGDFGGNSGISFLFFKIDDMGNEILFVNLVN
jgi:hypothetical protein